MNKALKFQLFDAVKIDKEKTSVKLTEAPVIKQKDKGKFMVFRKFGVVQCDLIYMREDPAGFKYILTVVDVATRVMDAIPLRGRESEDVIEGFEQVFKNGHITNDIMVLYTDSGSEFKNNDFKDYMKGKDIPIRYTMTNRHSQMAIVEYVNHLITKTLGIKMTSEELDTKEHYNNWAELLPKIVEVLNKKDNMKIPKLSDFFGEPKASNKEIESALQVGDVVHVRLQQPRDHMAETNNRLHGTFRNGDLRYNQTCTEIINVIILPKQPVRYMVKGLTTTSFIRKELLLADANEITEYRKSNPAVKPKENTDQPDNEGSIMSRIKAKKRN